MLAGACLVASVGACTWLDDPYVATPLQRDAGSLEAPATADAAGGAAGSSATAAAVASASTASAGCSGEPQGDVLGSVCPQVITLTEPAAPGAVSANSATDAGAGADAAAARACPAGFGEFGAPELVTTGLVSNGNFFGPALSPDGLHLYFSVALPGSEQIYTATRQGLDSAVFSQATEVAPLNSAALEGSPFISRDDRRIYFFSDRNAGSRDIWFSERADAGAAFSAPVLLGGVNTPSFEHLPWLAADELSILFVSSRPNGRNSDIWSATRARTDVPFGAAINLAALNSVATEGRVALSADGLSATFSSDRPGTLGAADIWAASRPDLGSAFSAPRNLAQLNSSAADLDVALSRDERELFFASSRNGVSLLWRSTRGCS
jgi:WD40 repeat protein